MSTIPENEGPAGTPRQQTVNTAGVATGNGADPEHADPFATARVVQGLEHLGRALVGPNGELSGSPANWENLRGQRYPLGHVHIGSPDEVAALLAEYPPAVPVPATSADDAGGPRVPSRPKDRVRWVATWRAVRQQFQRGDSYEKMGGWLELVHPDLAPSTRTLRDICQAGVAGGLDE